MYTNTTLAALLQRHLSFWKMENVDQPLVGVYLGGYLVNDIYKVAAEGSTLHPEQMIPERFFDLFWQDYLDLSQIDQDLVYAVQPLSSVPWLEGILGCTITVLAQSVWAEPLLGLNEPLDGFKPEWISEWFKTAEKSMKILSNHFTPLEVPMAGPFLRGPADVIAALIGAERLCFEVIDSPIQIRRLAHLCTQAWIRASRELISKISAWHGGHVLGARYIYAPGPCTYASEDITCIFSSKIYKEIFLPFDQVIAEQFPYGFMHRHSPSMHHLEALLELQPGWAIEVTMDPGGPSVADILPVLKRIQKANRPLIIFGLNDPGEIEQLVSGLSPRGLCVTIQADTPDQAKYLVGVARKTHARVCPN